MIYCDTSLLVSIITAEKHSAMARSWFFAADRQSCAISDWSRTEVASALAKKYRSGFIDEDHRRLAQIGWRALDTELTSLPVLPLHFLRATTLVDTPPHGLRSGDALHLAIALEHGCDLATFDVHLAAATRTVGVAIHLGP